ncbi:membrane protein FAM174B [Paramormyrops kingsleyae]|uniref:Family with sequence similarity 174 member B n=1 Tax=Paramormyrops kingsleyae TaxID=1676925 RepID=A0A3B3R309_9TELE|nr:membrane protein FAM174B-like [Paramormyrops kingsleyae]
MTPLQIALCLLVAAAWKVSCELRTAPSPAATPDSASPMAEGARFNRSSNHSAPFGSRIYSIANDLPTLKSAVIFICAFTVFLIICLVIKMYRSGRKIRKTRKYDIITTPAERVEMAPLNEENYEEDDSTIFDVKYR